MKLLQHHQHELQILTRADVNSDLPLEPETETIFSLILISTPDGIDTGFLATLDMIKKPHK